MTLTETEGKITVGEPFSPPERLIVLGAGHIAVPVCDFAAKIWHGGELGKDTKRGSGKKMQNPLPPRTHNVGYIRIVSTCDNSVV